MLDNGTSDLLNSTFTNSSSTGFRSISPARCVAIAVFALSTITFFVGISSWILIKKFRHFTNYLFLNIIFNNILNIVLDYFADEVMNRRSVSIQYVHGLTFLYFKVTANCWLLLLCYVFYVNLVKVFDGDIQRKYLKSTLFAWGLPLLIVGFAAGVMPNFDRSGCLTAKIYKWTLFSILLVNLLIYLRVLYDLFKTDVNNSGEKCRRVPVATVIFFISGSLFLVMPLRFYVNFPPYLSTVLVFLQPVVMDLYFFTVRLNRSVWRKYYDRELKNSLREINCRSN